MQTISFQGRTFRDDSESRHAIREIEWAEKILSEPVQVWPRGSSHTLAAEVLHESDDALLESSALRVTAYGQRVSA